MTYTVRFSGVFTGATTVDAIVSALSDELNGMGLRPRMIDIVPATTSYLLPTEWLQWDYTGSIVVDVQVALSQDQVFDLVTAAVRDQLGSTPIGATIAQVGEDTQPTTPTNPLTGLLDSATAPLRQLRSDTLWTLIVLSVLVAFALYVVGFGKGKVLSAKVLA